MLRGCYQSLERIRHLTPDVVEKADPAHLHRFKWLDDNRIGELPIEWNWLAEEYEVNNNANLIHYTLGTPCFKEYKNCAQSKDWHTAYKNMKHCEDSWLLQLADWLHNSDLASYIPDFIRIAESNIKQDVRYFDMVTRTSFSLSAEYTTLSTTLTRYIEMIRIQISTDPKVNLEFASPDSIDNDYATQYSGKPRVYTIVGDEIQIKPVPDSTYTSEAIYYSYYAQFSADADTNNLLVNHPDVYLFGALAAAESFSVNDPRIGIWKTQYNEIVQKINSANRNYRMGGPLKMRPQVVV